jgi:sulfatase modifying factor 1
MRLKILLISTLSFVFLIIIAKGAIFNLKLQNNQCFKKKYPKDLQPFMQDMVKIPGGTFKMGEKLKWFNITEDDSNLISPETVRNVTVSDFFLCSHEVTNKEYREFVLYARDSMARQIMSSVDTSFLKGTKTKWLNWEKPIDWNHEALLDRFVYDRRNDSYSLPIQILNDSIRFSFEVKTLNGKKTKSIYIYPDTMVMERIYLRPCQPAMFLYFIHPAYEDYPVVGVSWQQSFAYCIWKNMMLEKAMENHPLYKNILGEFHLPTEAQWEYVATKGVLKSVYFYRDLNWGTDNNNFKYIFNFGEVRDNNDLIVKDYDDDGLLYPYKYGYYKSNEFGIYNILGNVAEWVLEEESYESVNDIGNYRNRRDFNQIDDWNKKRITKGGSWIDNLIYCYPSSKVWYKPDCHSGRNGFRIAMSIPD